MNRSERVTRFIGPASGSDYLANLIDLAKRGQDTINVAPVLDCVSFNKIQSILNNFLTEYLGLNIDNSFQFNIKSILWANRTVFDELGAHIDSGSVYLPNAQLILLDPNYFKSFPRIYMLRSIIHEILHMLGQHIVRDKRPAIKRLGMKFHSALRRSSNPSNFTVYGSGLEEVLVEESVRIIFSKYSEDLPLAKEERAWMSEDEYVNNISRSLNAIKDKYGYTLRSSDVLYASRLTGNVDLTHSVVSFTYLEHREVLYYILNRVFLYFKENLDEWHNILQNTEQVELNNEEILKVFLMSRFFQETKTISTIVNKAIGSKKAFKVLMQMGITAKSAELTLERLKSMETIKLL